MSGDKVPRAPLPLSVPLVPSVKAASISFQRQKEKSLMWNFGIHRKKKLQSMETEGEGTPCQASDGAEGHRSRGPTGSREISFGRERVFH